MKNSIYFIFIILATSCQVTETITINEDGSGKITLEQLRNEQSYMQIVKENYVKEEIFKDSTYVFNDFITKYVKTFSKYTSPEQDLFKTYKNVTVNIKKSSVEKEFRTTISQNFDKVEAIPDLYKTEDYAEDVEKNYALTAEEHHYYKVSYTFDGTIFKRIIKITNPTELKSESDRIETYKSKIDSKKLIQTYVLEYHFSKKIRSVSNTNAKISKDKKSLSLQFSLSDCMQNPEITNLEVVLE